MLKMPTKRAMLETARKARQYGYYQHSPYSLGVNCPQCRTEVTASRSAHGERSIPKVLDAAMVAHLPACTVMLAVRDGEDVSSAPHEALADAVDLAPFNSPLQRTLDTIYRARLEADDAAALARLARS